MRGIRDAGKGGLSCCLLLFYLDEQVRSRSYGSVGDGLFRGYVGFREVRLCWTVSILPHSLYPAAVLSKVSRTWKNTLQYLDGFVLRTIFSWLLFDSKMFFDFSIFQIGGRFIQFDFFRLGLKEPPTMWTPTSSTWGYVGH